MLLLRLNNVSFRYEIQDSLVLQDITLTVDSRQKIGLVGGNGCGKTTLAELIRGTLSPLNGNVFRSKPLRIGYMPQDIVVSDGTTVEEFLWTARGDLLPVKRRMERFVSGDGGDYLALTEFQDRGGYRFEVEIERTLGSFGFSRKTLAASLACLSSGERSRISLGRVLLDKPDLLIMDEPTNHLDIEAMQWLENYLAKGSIPYIVISHDRHFLDACCTTIWELYDCGLACYAGNYTWYRTSKQQEHKRMMAEYEIQEKKIRQLTKAAAKRKEWAFSHQPQTGPNGYAPVYESIGNAAKSAMRQSKAIDRRIELTIRREAAKKPVIEKKHSISFEESSLKNRTVLTVDGLGKRYGDYQVLSGLSFMLPNGSRVAVSGRNGSGKTTLLNIITGRSEPSAGSIRWAPQAVIGYYSQEHETLDYQKTVMENMPPADGGEQTRIRTLLGCLDIRGETVFRRIDELSTGQRSKAAVAAVILSGANVLVLDEPTNHLEIAAREALEDALLDYTGTIIFVSHDRYFMNKLATHVLDIHTGKLAAYRQRNQE